MSQQQPPSETNPYAAPQSVPSIDTKKTPGLLVTAPQLFFAYLVAEGLLDRKLTAHYQAGGRAASLWKAFGIGMLCFVANMICVFGLALLQSDQVEADVFIV